MNVLPDVGDLVWLNFDPQAGREQAGQRPAIVVSNRIYHENSALTVVCPITRNISPYSFKVMLPEGGPVTGAILTDQLKSIDRNARRLGIIGRAPEGVVAEVQAKLAALLGLVN